MASRFVQESGSDEDYPCGLQIRHNRVVKESSGFHPKRGVHLIDRDNPNILKFLDEIASPRQQKDTFGLIWNKNLSPSQGYYEPGSHYCSSQEKDKKSLHGDVTFHRDGRTGTKFAIKSLLPSVRFNPKEITIGLREGHPNICSVYGIIVRSGRIHILLEHAGHPLMEQREWIAKSPDHIMLAVKQCFSALEFLSANDLVHCDVKPDNFTVVGDRNDFTIKLIDFGSCQKRGTQLPKHAHTTKEYWSPEVWQALDQKRDVVCDPSMDIYALALTVYCILESNHLTQRILDVKEVMTRNPEYIKLIALPESLSADLREVLNPCFEADPRKRLTANNAVQLLHVLHDVTTPTRSMKKTSEGNFQGALGTDKTSPAHTQNKERASRIFCTEEDEKLITYTDRIAINSVLRIKKANSETKAGHSMSGHDCHLSESQVAIIAKEVDDQTITKYCQGRHTTEDIRTVIMRPEEGTPSVIMRFSGREELNYESVAVSSPEKPGISQCFPAMSSHTSNTRSHDKCCKKRSGDPSQCSVPQKVQKKDLLPD